MFNKLPCEYTFNYDPVAKLYLPNQHIPTQIKGIGEITLLFEPTENEHILSVRLTDMHLELLPFLLPLNFEDELSRCSEFHDLRLSNEMLDLDKCNGTLNLQNGEFGLRFAYLLTPRHIPVLEKLEFNSIEFEVRERGEMNIRTGNYSLFSGANIIESGPFKGTCIVGGDTTGTISGPTPSSIELNVFIINKGLKTCKDKVQKSVIICPGDQILLCWSASPDVSSVNLDPGGIKGLPPVGQQVITPPALPSNVAPQYIYRVSTVGGNNPGTDDSVIVEFYRGRWIPYVANTDGQSKWIALMSPDSISGKIKVGEVEVEAGKGCVNWRIFQLQHFNFDYNHQDFGGQVFRPSAGTVNPPIPEYRQFQAAGKWDFFALPDSQEKTGILQPDPKDEKTLCFKFKGQCYR